MTAAAAATATALSGIIAFVALSVAGWFNAETGSFADAVRVGLTAWLFGNGSGLVVAGTSITVLPLGLLVLLGWLLHRAGRWTARRLGLTELREVGLVTASFAASYTAVALIAYLVTRSGAAHAIGWRVVMAPLLLAAMAGGSGVLRESGLADALLGRLPEEARAALTGGLAAVAAMLAASALLFTVSMVMHFSNAVKLAEGLHSGLFGGIILALAGLAFAPNAILCAGAYLAGPGFSVGSGTVVSPGQVDLGPLPAHPLFAALPASADAWWQSGLLIVPLLAGVVAGLVAIRRYPVSGLDRAAIRGGVAGLAGGVLFGLLTGLATGSIGPGRMQEVGPDVLPTVGLCAVSLLVGGSLAAVASRWLDRSPQPSDDSLS